MPTLDSINQARVEWEQKTQKKYCSRFNKRREIIDEFRQYGDAKAILVWGEDCTISKIETLKANSGAGANLLVFLKYLADKYKINLFGNATSYMPCNSLFEKELLCQNQLENWYLKHGFKCYRNSLGIIEISYPVKKH